MHFPIARPLKEKVLRNGSSSEVEVPRHGFSVPHPSFRHGKAGSIFCLVCLPFLHFAPIHIYSDYHW